MTGHSQEVCGLAWSPGTMNNIFLDEMETSFDDEKNYLFRSHNVPQK